tara:strand:- start:3039 stop:3410 length:372 start_codon:yes stop_codon:yes gene_type:complete
MLKKIAGALSAIALSAGAAVAAPGYYVNVENNAGWIGSDSVGNATDFAIGVDGMLGESFAWYGQLGPQLQVPNGGDTDVVLSGKIGGSLPITDTTSAYVEASFVTDDDANAYATKLGFTTRFN